MAAPDANWKRDRRQVVVWLIVASLFVLDQVVEDAADHSNDLKGIAMIVLKSLLMATAVGLAIRAARQWGRLLERSEAQAQTAQDD